MRLIKEYQVSIEEAFGILRFEIGEIKGRGQPEKFALLTEDQATFVIMLTRNTPPVRKFKRALVKAFRDTGIDWLPTRPRSPDPQNPRASLADSGSAATSA